MDAVAGGEGPARLDRQTHHYLLGLDAAVGKFAEARESTAGHRVRILLLWIAPDYRADRAHSPIPEALVARVITESQSEKARAPS